MSNNENNKTYLIVEVDENTPFKNLRLFPDTKLVNVLTEEEYDACMGQIGIDEPSENDVVDANEIIPEKPSSGIIEGPVYKNEDEKCIFHPLTIINVRYKNGDVHYNTIAGNEYWKFFSVGWAVDYYQPVFDSDGILYISVASSKVPAWANYVANDADGSVVFFKYKPKPDYDFGEWHCDYREASVELTSTLADLYLLEKIYWVDTLHRLFRN